MADRSALIHGPEDALWEGKFIDRGMVRAQEVELGGGEGGGGVEVEVGKEEQR
jgi:hypothetical protein